MDAEDPPRKRGEHKRKPVRPGPPPHPWEQQRNEGPKPFAAFKVWFDLPEAERSHAAVASAIGKSVTLVAGWSSQWQWADRLRQYGNHLDRVRQDAADAEAAKRAAVWEKRRQEDLELIHRAQRAVYDRAMEILKDQSRRVATDRDLTALVKTFAELASMTWGEAVADIEPFDADAASPEECQAYVQREEARRRAKLGIGVK